MKKIICVLLSLILVFGLCACGGSGAKADPNALQAGFARLDCIPDDPLVHIAGGTAADAGIVQREIFRYRSNAFHHWVLLYDSCSYGTAWVKLT